MQPLTAELITDYDAIKQEIGLNIERDFLYLNIALDSSKDGAPTLVKTSNGRYYLIAREIEKGNCSEHGSAYAALTAHSVNMIYTGSYFTWEAAARNIKPGESKDGKALSKVVSLDSISIHDDMPYEKYRGFAEEFNTTVIPSLKNPSKAFVYGLATQDVISKYIEGRWLAVETASKLLDELSSLDSEEKRLVRQYMERDMSNTFPFLDRLMAGKADAVMASSKITVNEMTSLPWDLLDDVLALYDGKMIYVISPRPLQSPMLKKPLDFPGLRAALDSIIGNGIVGIEEKHLPVGKVLEIGTDKITSATGICRQWREQTALRDLPYYIIGGHATRTAMEQSLAFVEKKVQTGEYVSEIDCENKFHEQVQVFCQKYCPFLKMKRYFVVCHTGSRTQYSSVAMDYPVNNKSNSLKLDAGILIFQDDIMRACTDQARSIAFTIEGKKLYNLAWESILKAGIPAARPGNTGRDVFWAGIAPFIENEKEIKNWGMLPPGVTIQDNYTRDIGHILGKQEPVTLGCTRYQKTQALQDGMIGSIEYQWPYNNHAIGIEDSYLVTKNRGIDITR